MTYISAIRNKELYTNIMATRIIGEDNGLYLAICIALKRRTVIQMAKVDIKLTVYVQAEGANILAQTEGVKVYQSKGTED